MIRTLMKLLSFLMLFSAAKKGPGALARNRARRAGHRGLGKWL